MSKDYYVEVKFHANRWTLIKTFKRQGEAMDFIANSEDSQYPLRITRVVRTVVFEDKKK